MGFKVALRKYLVRGISELYTDLILTLVVLSISGALLGSVVGFTRGIHDNVSDSKLPLTYALLVKGSDNDLLILCNYGDYVANLTILLNDSIVLGEISLKPKSFTIVKLSASEASGYSLSILVNGDVVIKPSVAEV